MSDVRDYNKDIEIDENDLEAVWLEHPAIVMYYNKALADAQYNKDKLKIKLDQESAKLDADVRKNWKELNFDSKPTENAIRSWIILHPTYRKAELRHLKAIHEVNNLTGVRSSFEHRKKALENIVSLRITGFHSEPRNKVKQINHNARGGHGEKTQGLNRNRAGSRKPKK